MEEVKTAQKFKQKLDKMETEVAKAKEDLTKAKAASKDSMKQSYEDIELWKQKELAKGKDPTKVEKQYQRGLKTLERVYSRIDRFHERMDTKVEDWEYKGRVKLEKAAQRKLMKKVFTSSLAKMEQIIAEDPDTELRYPIAGYCAIKKKDSLNPVKHPNLTREVKKWEEAIKKASQKNEYFKTFLSLCADGDMKNNKLQFKKDVAETVNMILERDNISIRFLSDYSKIKYANIYNFLKKEIYTDLSFKRAHKLLWLTINIKEGYTREEAFHKYSQIIRDNWDDNKIMEVEIKEKES